MIQDILSSLIGGLLFALIIFWINEYFFKVKNVSGEWTTLIKIKQTNNTPFINLGIEYKIHLLQLGDQISGRGEKIRDINPDGTNFHVYPNIKKVNIEITGYIERNYLKKSKLYLLIKENGTRRTTSASYNLTLNDKNRLSGFFESTAAESRGETFWTRIASTDQ